MGSSSQAELLQQGGTYDFVRVKTGIYNYIQKILGSSPPLALDWFKPSQVRSFCRLKPQWFTHPALRPRKKTRNKLKEKNPPWPAQKKITKLYNDMLLKIANLGASFFELCVCFSLFEW